VGAVPVVRRANLAVVIVVVEVVVRVRVVMFGVVVIGVGSLHSGCW
jgi:hypothetical protein